MDRACSAQGENKYELLVRKPKGKRALDTVGMVILKWILKRDRMGRYGLDCSGSG
jgi:hypothetical protein